MSDMSSSSSFNNEIQNLLEEQDEIIDELIENIDELNIDIQSNNKLERQLSGDIIEEYNYKIKSLLREENKLINKVLELKIKKKQ